MEPIAAIALAMGAAWASGVNLYAAVAVLGLMQANGLAELPPDLQVLAHPGIIMVACIMYFIEFFADKIPGLDSAWDALHTFIRIPAGAALAAMAIGDVSPIVTTMAALAGGSVTAASHASKASTRVLVNTSPEPFSNWFLSLGEDIAAIGAVWMSLNHPELTLVLLVLFIGLVIWLLPKIFRLIGQAIQRISDLFRKNKKPKKRVASETVSMPDANSGHIT